MKNLEVAYSLTDDFHNKHLQCSDIRGYSIENGSVRGFIAQNANVEIPFFKVGVHFAPPASPVKL